MESILGYLHIVEITVAVIAAVIAGLILYSIFGIGKDKKTVNKISNSPSISAGGNITAGRDIIVGSNISNTRNNIKLSKITPAQIGKNLDDLPLIRKKKQQPIIKVLKSDGNYSCSLHAKV